MPTFDLLSLSSNPLFVALIVILERFAIASCHKVKLYRWRVLGRLEKEGASLPGFGALCFFLLLWYWACL